MKTRKQHLITILLTLFLGLCSIHASAQTVTFTVQTSHSDRGKIKYRVNDGGYNDLAYIYPVTANVGDVITVSAMPTDGINYGFSYWNFDMDNPPIEGTNVSGYTFTVTADHNDAIITAQFTSWSCTDLQNGATYTLTTSGDDFMVSCPGDSRFNGKVFSYIDKVELNTEGGTATIVFNTSKTVWVLKRFRVVKGSLTLELGDDYTSGTTIQRDPRNAGNIDVDHNLVLVSPPSGITSELACQLAIRGKSSAKFVIHGNCNDMDIDNADPNNIHFTSTSGSKAEHALMSIGGGTVSMNYVKFTHAWNKRNSLPAGIYVFPDGASMPAKVTMTNSVIDWCYSTTYGAGITIYNETVSGSTFEMTNCEVSNCNTYGTTNECGGVIRTNGPSVCALTLDNCELHHNYSIYGGGAIRWNSTTAPLRLIDCNLHDNWTGGSGSGWTGGSGGALLAESNVTVSDCTIQNNTATGKGGGICVGGGTLTLTGTNAIQNNHASTDGGGIYKLGSLSVSSTPIIKRNTANGVVSNVFIPSDASEKYVNISGNLTSGALIGITKTTTDHAYSGDGGYYTDIASASTADIAATGIRRFYDDTQTCGVYSDYNSPYYSDPSSTSLYFVKYSTTEPTSWLNYTSSTSKDYTEVGTTVTVKSAAGMAYFASQVLAGNDYAGKTVNLDTDISLTGHNWVPVGYCMGGGETPQSFAGTFDGQGHTISGLSCSSSYPTVGLFGHVTGVVDNVLLGATITGSSATNLGGIAGIVGSGGAIRNSMAFVTLEGGSSTTMGSLVGSIETGGSLKNSFAKVISFENGSTVGGLVGNNAGTLQNCYVINSRSYVSSESDNYAAINTGTLENCYYGPIDPPLTSSGTNGTFTAASTTYNYGSDYNMESVMEKPLYQALNHWAEDNGISTYSRWMRMPTTDINGGYPLFDFFLYDCVASTDNMPHYSDDFNGLFGTYVAANDGDGEGTIYLFNTPALIDGTGNVNVSNKETATKLFIQEDVALKPTTGSKDAGDIIATTGVTLKNLQSSDDSWDWHMFSSALKDVPLGINYINLDEFGYGEAPTPVTDFEFLNTGYFPTVAANAETYREIDYYSYDEPSYHWINLKRNRFSHWNQYTGQNIPYPDESTMTSGKGYLMALKQETLLQATGTLNNGEVSIAVTKLGEYRTGYNFLGNPYQSYLDFDAFAAYTDATHDNRNLWEDNSVSNASYIILDKDGYHSYAYDQSNNTFAPNQYLHPHQGFMIIVKGDADEAAFDNSMRNTTATADFRDERPNYPLVNLIVTEADGARDLTTVELGRPDKGGALKAYDLHKGKGCIYTHYEDEDWAIAFTQPGISEVGVRFEADEAATFTMTWDMENGEFHYLHLIDNMAGTDIDCLSATEYRFTATPDDYKSRFRLVFGYTGIEEPETDEPAEGTSAFAFQMGNELVVNGEGQLEIIDMMGRTVRTAQLQGSQSTMPMPRVSAGVYVLRLTDKGVTRVQKIVVD